MNFPQQPQAPGYPTQPQYQPQPGFAAPSAPVPTPGYAPTPGYGQAQANGFYPPQQPVAPPAPVLPRGTLEDFMDQASGGGTSVTKFFGVRPQGSWIQFQVERDIVDSDIQPQTDSNNNIRYQMVGGQPDYNRPKWVLILKCRVLATSDGDACPSIFSDGAAAVWIKGITRDAFTAAMAAAGIPDADKALGRGKLGGAVFVMQSNGERPSNRAGYAATKLYNFTYTPGGREHLVDPTAAAPQAAAPVPAPVQAPPTAVAPPAPAPIQPAYQAPVPAAPAMTPPPPAQFQPPAPGVPAAPPAAAPLPAAVPPPAVPPVPQGYAPPTAGVPAPPVPGTPPAPPISAEKQQLLAELKGQAQ